jgi:hypothetical protein
MTRSVDAAALANVCMAHSTGNVGRYVWLAWHEKRLRAQWECMEKLRQSPEYHDLMRHVPPPAEAVAPT